MEQSAIKVSPYPVMPGWRYFACPTCDARWREATRDVLTPAKTGCIDFDNGCDNDAVSPLMIKEPRLDWKVTASGNLINPPPDGRMLVIIEGLEDLRPRGREGGYTVSQAAKMLVKAVHNTSTTVSDGDELVGDEDDMMTAFDPVLQVLVRDMYELQTRKVQEQRHELMTHRQKAKGEYWAWQGDGSDHLETVTCPVLIAAADLREIVGKAALIGEQKEAKKDGG